MTDTERLDAIIREVEGTLGAGWWWNVMHDIHANKFRDQPRSPRQMIDDAKMRESLEK